MDKEELVECAKKEKSATKELTLESFQADDNKVKFYTGLPSFLNMKILFDFIAPNIKEHHHASLSNFQQFLLVLMKLCLNLMDLCLAYRFGILKSTVSKLIKKWLEIMYVRLRPPVK